MDCAEHKFAMLIYIRRRHTTRAVSVTFRQTKLADYELYDKSEFVGRSKRNETIMHIFNSKKYS